MRKKILPKQNKKIDPNTKTKELDFNPPEKCLLENKGERDFLSKERERILCFLSFLIYVSNMNYMFNF